MAATSPQLLLPLTFKEKKKPRHHDSALFCVCKEAFGDLCADSRGEWTSAG